MIRKGLIGSIPMMLLIIAFSALGWFLAPAGEPIPVHWNAAGEVNRSGGPGEAFLTIPAVALGLILVFAVAPKIDPRGRNLERSQALWLTGWIGGLAILAVAQGAITLTAIGLIDAGTPTFPRIIGSAVALFIAVIGNVLGKARPNWFGGIRTPWTLSSDRSWDVTHRWAGRLFMLAGLLSVPALWLTAVNVGWIVMAVMIGLAVLISFVVSYWVWRNDPERETFSVDDEQKPSSGHSGPKA
jgi:uncharacterized membrane protein